MHPRQYLLAFCLMVFIQHSGSSQKGLLFASKTAPYAFSKLGAVKSCAGITNNTYYIIENDYGTRGDFKNNIRTSVAAFSLDGKFKKRFNLNEMAASSGKEVDKILFCDVIAWKDRIAGFYTYKNANAKNFSAYGILCDPEGKLIKTGIEIGDFQHDYKDGTYLWQGGLLINGRNTLSVVKDFQYRMTPDSSVIVVLCSPPADGTGNTRFRVYDKELDLKKEIAVTIPLQNKVADLNDFAMDNNGVLFLLTRTYKSKSERKKMSDDDDNFYELHAIDTRNNNKLNTVPLNIDGKVINTANLILKQEGQLYCFGTYSDGDNKKSRGNTTGVFSAWVDPLSPATFKKSAYDIPDSEYETLIEIGGKKNKNGINDKFSLYESVPDNTGGVYVIMSCETLIVTVRGQTGAMNTYKEQTGNMLITYINKEKRIKWCTGLKDFSWNPEMMTRTDRFLFFERGQTLHAAFVSSHMVGMEPQSLYERPFNNITGSHPRESTKIVGAVPPNYAGAKTVEKSILPLGNGEFILTMVGAQLGFFKFRID